MKYETKKRKLFESVQGGNKNTDDANNLNNIKLVNKPENVFKNTQVISLIKKYNFPFGVIHVPFDSRVNVISGFSIPLKHMIFSVDLAGMPEWAVPFSKVIPKAYMDDYFNIDSYVLDTFCKHWWKQIDATHYRLYVDIYVTAKTDVNSTDYLPIFVDVDLVIFNERVWEELNPTKS